MQPGFEAFVAHSEHRVAGAPADVGPGSAVPYSSVVTP
jgi:hypothetical protein